MRAFDLSVGEPWDFVGPDGENRIEVEFVGLVAGPDRRNRQALYARLRVLRPFMWEGEPVEELVAGIRYSGDTIEQVVERGGTVQVSRVLAEVNLDDRGPFKVEDVEYIIIGGLRPIQRSAV
jgi:hypothetical protein